MAGWVGVWMDRWMVGQTDRYLDRLQEVWVRDMDNDITDFGQCHIYMDPI